MPVNYKEYHPKWTLIRRLILKRAGNCCEKCGVKDGTEIYNFGQVLILPSLFPDEMDPEFVLILKEHSTTLVVLTIAHKNHDRTFNRFENLAAWCQKCHLAHDLAQRIYSFKYGKETQYKNLKLFAND